MEIKFDWEKLKVGKCPNTDCDSLLQKDGKFVECEHCFFKVSFDKYNEIIKPKEKNKYYQKKVGILRRLKQYKVKQSEKHNLYLRKQNKERIGNLKKMLRTGRITKDYYDSKIKLYESTF